MKGQRNVIFVTVKDTRLERILEELPTDQGTLFTVVEAQYFLANPMGQCYIVASRRSDYQSLTDFIPNVNSNIQTDVLTDDTIEEF